MKDGEGLVFVFLPQSRIGHSGINIRLRGLCPDSRYTLITDEGDITKSGAYLTNHGFDIKLNGDYASSIIKIKKA